MCSASQSGISRTNINRGTRIRHSVGIAVRTRLQIPVFPLAQLFLYLTRGAKKDLLAEISILHRAHPPLLHSHLRQSTDRTKHTPPPCLFRSCRSTRTSLLPPQSLSLLSWRPESRRSARCDGEDVGRENDLFSRGEGESGCEVLCKNPGSKRDTHRFPCCRTRVANKKQQYPRRETVHALIAIHQSGRLQRSHLHSTSTIRSTFFSQ